MEHAKIDGAYERSTVNWFQYNLCGQSCLLMIWWFTSKKFQGWDLKRVDERQGQATHRNQN